MHKQAPRGLPLPMKGGKSQYDCLNSVVASQNKTNILQSLKLNEILLNYIFLKTKAFTLHFS